MMQPDAKPRVRYGIDLPKTPTPRDFVGALREWVAAYDENCDNGKLAARAGLAYTRPASADRRAAMEGFH